MDYELLWIVAFVVSLALYMRQRSVMKERETRFFSLLESCERSLRIIATKHEHENQIRARVLDLDQHPEADRAAKTQASMNTQNT